MERTTDVFSFLRAIPYLETIGPALLNNLAKRFNLSSDILGILIQIAKSGGLIYDN